MKQQFAKFENGSLKFFNGRIPNVVNPDEETLLSYLISNGYKPYETSTAPGMYYTESYKETKAKITQVWKPIDLAAAKEQALGTVQQELDMSLPVRTVIECTGFENGIIYDQDALINVMGLSAGDSYIDAQDEIHILTEENITNITQTLKAKRQSLYGKAMLKRAGIAAAKNVDEVEEAQKTPLENF